MVKLEIVAYVTKKPGDIDVRDDFWVSKLEVYPLGEKYKDAPLVDLKWNYEQRYVDGKKVMNRLFVVTSSMIDGPGLMRYILEQAYTLGKVNINAIDQITIFMKKGVPPDDLWVKRREWNRGDTYIPPILLSKRAPKMTP